MHGCNISAQCMGVKHFYQFIYQFMGAKYLGHTGTLSCLPGPWKQYKVSWGREYYRGVGGNMQGEIRRGGAEETEKQRKKQTISWCLWFSSLSLNLWTSGLSWDSSSSHDSSLPVSLLTSSANTDTCSPALSSCNNTTSYSTILKPHITLQ